MEGCRKDVCIEGTRYADITLAIAGSLEDPDRILGTGRRMSLDPT